MDEVDAPKLKAGQLARVTFDALPGQIFAGKVRRIAPYVTEVEKQARTVDVEVDFEVDSDDLARIGQERHAVAIALLAALRRDGYELAYPTQTTYTAAPDGTLVMPYASIPPIAAPAPTESKPKPTGRAKTR